MVMSLFPQEPSLITRTKENQITKALLKSAFEPPGPVSLPGTENENKQRGKIEENKTERINDPYYLKYVMYINYVAEGLAWW